MQKQPVRVAVTGAAGQIGYALLFRIASGHLLGPDQPVSLRLLEVEAVLPALQGVVMELEDCAFPLVAGIEASSDPRVAFDGIDWGLLVGAAPRKQGMERRDLMSANAPIFQAQGQALNEVAGSGVRVLVVGNPCNTNCLIARSNARDVPAERFFAMTRLDQNRGRAMLAKRAGVPVTEVRNLAIWGNHSATQFPDFAHATIGGSPAVDVIGDREWLQGEFVKAVQQRGAAVIAARGASSAASAANAAIDSVNSIWRATADGDNAALAVVSHGEYGIPSGLQFGFPVSSDGDSWRVIEGFEHDGFARERIAVTSKELEDERNEVSHLLPG